jgi:4-hydroxybenzoate polyprenyltransferase/phosphoserine phosphatase
LLGTDSGDKRPLVVDLDGTLLKTDLLFESANEYVVRHPFRSYRVARWLLCGKGKLKACLAERVEIDPATLPYNKQLLAWLREEKAKGRHLVLATASHRLLAQQVSEHLGIFDAVVASDETVNLKSHRKRDELVGRYGDRGFDYVGNGTADLVVWKSAQRAYVVSASSSLIAKARLAGNVAQVFNDGRQPVAKSLVRSLRPHQWVKNLLIFVPLFAAHRHGDVSSVGRALLALVAFCLAASGTYLLNDVIDVEHDRHHFKKARRPFASGDLSLLWGWLGWPVLFFAAFAIAGWLLPTGLVVALAVYVALTVGYSLWLKRIVMVDVLVLAGLYSLRVAAGAYAIEVVLSFWLLAFSLFMFLSLALIKRYSELKSGDDGEGRRIRGRGYFQNDLDVVQSLGTGAGYIAVLVLALYIEDAYTAELYPSPRFIWLACPLLLYWISRAWVIAHRGQMHDDPIVFALKDRVSWLVVACLIVLFVLAGLVP